MLIELILLGSTMKEDSSTNEGLNLKGIELSSAGPVHLAVAEGNIEKFLEVLRKAEEAFKSIHEEDLSDEKPSLDDFINPGAKILIDLTYLNSEDLPSSSSSQQETKNVTPLHVAAFLGHVEIFEILFDKVNLIKTRVKARFKSIPLHQYFEFCATLRHWLAQRFQNKIE